MSDDYRVCRLQLSVISEFVMADVVDHYWLPLPLSLLLFTLFDDVGPCKYFLSVCNFLGTDIILSAHVNIFCLSVIFWPLFDIFLSFE